MDARYVAEFTAHGRVKVESGEEWVYVRDAGKLIVMGKGVVPPAQGHVSADEQKQSDSLANFVIAPKKVTRHGIVRASEFAIAVAHFAELSFIEGDDGIHAPVRFGDRDYNAYVVMRGLFAIGIQRMPLLVESFVAPIVKHLVLRMTVNDTRVYVVGLEKKADRAFYTMECES